ncbi:Transposable element Tc1 transposase [Labeo rohita]|uniref:Transposable element Tc1 transposase n=1 Tax=Labeo rohita TaxID=84645 RepID=A0ABQ8MR67_LABRO|nr:Transposable element Tc1 transposase [Labeo rohita]
MVKNKPFFSRIATDAAARRGAAQICDVTSSAQSKSPAHMLLSKITNLSRRQSLTPFTRRVSHKHSLPKKLAVHRVLYPSMLTESSVEGLEEKDAQSTERTAALKGKQNRFKNLGELHKEWTEAGVKASRATTHRRVKEFGYSCRFPLVKPLLNHRQCQRHLTWAKEKKKWTVAQWSKVLFSDESKFCISFANQGPRV